MAAAESYQQAANDAAWDSRTDGVDDPPKTAEQRAQDAFWAHDPNRPPPPPVATEPPSSGGGGSDNGASGTEAGSGSSGSGDPATAGGDGPSGTTGGGGSKPQPIPVRDDTAGGTYPLTPQQAADLHAAGAGKVYTDGKGNYFLDTSNDGGIKVTDKAIPEPPPPPPPIVWTPSYGDYNNPPPVMDPEPLPPSEPPRVLPQEPGLVPSPIQLDDLIPFGTIAKGIGKLIEKLIGKLGKEGAEKIGKEAAERLGKEGAEKLGTEGAGKATPTPPPKDTPPPPGTVATEAGEKTLTVQGVSRPTVENPKLNNIVNDLYKGDKTANPIGTGSTADAIRHEAKTGEPVGGKWHTEKGEQYSRALEKWLDKNPNASDSDRAAAQAMLDDLRNALEGR
jgi:hypothetical protein